LKKDDVKFIVAVILTAVISMLVIFSLDRKVSGEMAGSRVDIDKINNMVEKGTISIHDASHWEKVRERKIER
jgi:hypothetical protein